MYFLCLSKASLNNMASEYASSPVEQPQTQTRISCFSNPFFNKYGITFFSRLKKTSLSLKNEVTPIKKS